MGQPRFDNAVLEGLSLVRWYAREHVILCLLPAFVIAGAMAVYISQGAVMKHLGPQAPKPLAFTVASVEEPMSAVPPLPHRRSTGVIEQPSVDRPCHLAMLHAAEQRHGPRAAHRTLPSLVRRRS